MTITAQGIITAASLIGAAGAIFGLVFAVYRWYLRQNKDSEEINHLKKENTLICYALSACLDGLIQLGANHTVPVAKDNLDKYLNQSAHGQE